MFDAIVVGGSYAGLAAALQLARARRQVLVVDAGKRRNRFVTHSHGFLGQDGAEAAAIAANAKRQLMAYSTVTWVEGEARSARGTLDRFTVGLDGDRTFEGRRVVLALGVRDELPPIEGMAERWGKSIFHCPYCHGYELDGGDIGVIATMPSSIHQGLMLADWGKTTYFTRGLFEPTPEELASLDRRGVTVERGAVVAVAGAESAPVVMVEGGRGLAFRGLFVASKTHIASAIAAELGCAFEEGPLGAFVKTDAMKDTGVPGVFACGDMAMGAGSVSFAVADGARAGISAHRSLVFG